MLPGETVRARIFPVRTAREHGARACSGVGRATALGLAMLCLSGCAALQRVRTLYAREQARPDPARIGFDLYAQTKASPAAATLPVATPQEAAAVALRDAPLLEHLRMIDGRYAGRRMPRLAWTALVERIPPPDAPPAKAARLDPAAYWRVKLVSSTVRGSALYYACEVRISMVGENLTAARNRAGICAWAQ